MNLGNIFSVWDDVRGNEETFISYLKKNRWVKKRGFSFKCVFFKDSYVLKFDLGMKLNKDGFLAYGTDAQHSHTASEYRSWKRSLSKPHRIKYICPVIAYHRGILIQPCLDHVNDEIYAVDPELLKIALRLRFSHFWSYGFLNGEPKWFDVDSLGSGWNNWKLRKEKNAENSR